MLKHNNRILFLKEFTKELILQSKSNIIEFKPETSAIKEVASFEIMVPSEIIPEEQKTITIQSQEPGKIIKPMQQIRQNQQIKMQQKPQFQPIRNLVKPIQIIKPVQYIKVMQPRKPLINAQNISSVPYTPSITEMSNQIIFNLGKLDAFIKDPRVTVIECPGPDKFILARTSGETTVTKISLTQEEINQIINNFSRGAKIPVMPGLFKAAAGNLIITAVVSDLVGSRFIITKITPSYILEQATGFQ